MEIKLILIPIISALIGWVTNYLAIKMLFHPKEPMNLGFFKLQGIFPKRKNQLAEKLGQVVANDLLSIDKLKENIKSGGTGNTSELLEAHLDKFLKDKLVEAFPMLGMFLTKDMVNNIKKVLIVEFEAVMPQFIDSYVDGIGEKLNIKEIVQEKVSSFSSEKLEDLLFSILKKEFKFIELSGAILGFVIGIIQLFIMQL